MECSRDLHADYVNIDAMLSVFDACLGRLTRDRYVDPQMLRGLLRFFAEYVQGSHQLKVEALVLSLVARKRIPPEAEALAELRSGYRSGGALLEAIAPHVTQLSNGRAEIASLISSAVGYITHSRQHFLMERSLLDGWLSKGLPPEEDEALTAEFARLERNSIGPTAREWYTQVILDYRDIVSTWSHPPHRAGDRP